MKKRLAHLPKQKRSELKLIVKEICKLTRPEMIILFGSYARGDFKDGPHQQGRGQLTIHKKSDYDVLVVTPDRPIADNADLWKKLQAQCAKLALSTHVRVIARDAAFITLKLEEGQYFFTDIFKEAVCLYDSGNFQLPKRKRQTRKKQKRIAQEYFNEWFTTAKGSYVMYEQAVKVREYKWGAFHLHQATEHSYKAVLLVFTGECPQEHYLDILGRLAADLCGSAFADVFPMSTQRQKNLFNLLDYAYIGARYDPKYKITKTQLEHLAKHVQKLRRLTKKICEEKVESLV